MDSFLQEQHTTGVEDSSGVFTVSPEQARQKLQAYQLGEPALYLLKFVQAAVSAGADRLDIKVKRDRLEIAFNPPDETVRDPHRVAAALLQVHSLSPSPLRHLAVGLNAAASAVRRHLDGRRSGWVRGDAQQAGL